VLLHAGCAALVTGIARRFVGTVGAVGAGLLFAVHPVHVESVAFVSGRTDLWMTLFALGAVSLWLPRDGVRSVPRTLLSAALFLASALSKETVLLLPGVLLAWDALAAGTAPGKWVSRNLAWVSAWGVAVAVVMGLRSAAGVGFGADDPSGASASLLAISATHLRLLTIPWPLNAAYSAAALLLTAPVLLGAAATVGVLASAAGMRSSARGLGRAAAVWTLAFLIPVSGLFGVSGSPAAERFLYLPSVGFCLAVGVLVDRLARTSVPAARRIGLGAGAALVVLLAAGTVTRARIWESDLTLYADIARTSPDRPLAHNNLGLEYHRAGRHDEALAAFDRAIALNPTYALPHTNRGLALARLGRIPEAVRAFETAVELDPANPGLRLNLGNGYRAARNLDGAIAQYETAAAALPAAADVHLLLGQAYVEAGRPDDARTVVGNLRRMGSPLADRLAGALSAP
ncbi:MAG: tetratricopeptide repeat protein, partial [Gemmatimonadetes bacterium]|nr:tetratricopeptide repeat protein [Gemmatimonadota bacterium]